MFSFNSSSFLCLHPEACTQFTFNVCLFCKVSVVLREFFFLGITPGKHFINPCIGTTGFVFCLSSNNKKSYSPKPQSQLAVRLVPGASLTIFCSGLGILEPSGYGDNEGHTIFKAETESTASSAVWATLTHFFGFYLFQK